MNYHFGQAEAADFGFLYRLIVVCLKEYVTAIWGWDEDFQRSHFAAHFDPAASYIVVVCGRDIGQLSVEDRPEERFLSGIFLLPAYQGQGLGSQIIGDVLAGARDGNRPVRLQVLNGNPARRLYERLGFKAVGRTHTHILMRSD
jgi:GNAT superfamily N-acetyltransferase